MKNLNPLWICTRCGGMRRASGRLGGALHLTCTSCDATTHFRSLEEAVQAEEHMTRQQAHPPN